MSTPPKTWQETMEPWERQWCEWELESRKDSLRREFYGAPGLGFGNERAARAWKSSQVRRFKKLDGYGPEGLCAQRLTWTRRRWSWRKFRFDKYLFGLDTWIMD